MILTFVLVYELIQMILEKNNMHAFDTFNIFKWVFKTFVATYLLKMCIRDRGYGERIAVQCQKPYTDKNAAMKYLEGRKKAYSHLFRS